MNKCCEKWKNKIYGWTFCPECGSKLESEYCECKKPDWKIEEAEKCSACHKPIKPKREKYPMCKDQRVQLDCRLSGCKFNKGGGNCDNCSPAITLNEDRKYTCWSSDYDDKPKRELLEKIGQIQIDDWDKKCEFSLVCLADKINEIIDYLIDTQ